MLRLYFLFYLFFLTFQAQWTNRPKDTHWETAERSTITVLLLATLSGYNDNQIQMQPRDGWRASKTGK